MCNNRAYSLYILRKRHSRDHCVLKRVLAGSPHTLDSIEARPRDFSSSCQYYIFVLFVARYMLYIMMALCAMQRNWLRCFSIDARLKRRERREEGRVASVEMRQTHKQDFYARCKSSTRVTY